MEKKNNYILVLDNEKIKNNIVIARIPNSKLKLAREIKKYWIEISNRPHTLYKEIK